MSIRLALWPDYQSRRWPYECPITPNMGGTRGLTSSLKTLRRCCMRGDGTFSVFLGQRFLR